MRGCCSILQYVVLCTYQDSINKVAHRIVCVREGIVACCSALQCTAVCFGMLQTVDQDGINKTAHKERACARVLQCVAVCSVHTRVCVCEGAVVNCSMLYFVLTKTVSTKSRLEQRACARVL